MVTVPSFPQVVAHRGVESHAAEHTLIGYQRALDEGAEALECDVRLTADGHLVCVHDSRIDRTSTGKGRVSNKTLTELQEHDFAQWWEGDAEPPPGEILTLEQLVELTVASPRDIDLVIETKHPTRYGGYAEQVVVQTLERFGLAHPESGSESRVRVMSFSTLAMRRMRELAPSIPTVYLVERSPVLIRSGHLPFDARIVGVAIDIIRNDPAAVDRWFAVGNEVHAWTIDAREDLELCMRRGVTAIITNRPGDAINWRAELWRNLTGAAPAAHEGS